MTHYEVLNVSEKASAPVIKVTYRLLMKAFHPDYLANPSDDLTTQQALELVKAINAAYFVLSIRADVQVMTRNSGHRERLFTFRKTTG